MNIVANQVADHQTDKEIEVTKVLKAESFAESKHIVFLCFLVGSPLYIHLNVLLRF